MTPDAAAVASKHDTTNELLATLLRSGAISEDALLDFLSDHFQLSVLPADAAPTLEAVRQGLAIIDAPIHWYIEHDVIVWRDANEIINAAGPRLHEASIQEALEQWIAEGANLHLAKSIVVDPILMALRGEHQRNALTDPRRLAELAEEAPVIDFVNSVFSEALSRGASDIHFEPFEDKLIVRMRVDGVLTQRRVAGVDMFDAVSSRLKLLSGMNIAERRLPQDGRQTIKVAGHDVDLRVSSLPTTWGESIVLRLLGATHRIPELGELGFTEPQRELILEAIKQPHGLVLITGPTGSGKTTTVYRLLSELNDGVRKIVTIEDPVELNLPGVLQMGVRADIALDFAAGLRSILRQDPDVIFVGEIRDAETAQIAVQAALTGHLVISTVHTNSALAAAARLHDLGLSLSYSPTLCACSSGNDLCAAFAHIAGCWIAIQMLNAMGNVCLARRCLRARRTGATGWDAKCARHPDIKAASACLKWRASRRRCSKRSAAANLKEISPPWRGAMDFRHCSRTPCLKQETGRRRLSKRSGSLGAEHERAAFRRAGHK
ncbi:MAG: GspE/PulE family protein [Hyphomonadaceae bacterium JAD_PAG50586_4]|nr:MAG: GspE/PulE family protein [Hyphomonadaceae bacterium JAD_PAG50586_4]